MSNRKIEQDKPRQISLSECTATNDAELRACLAKQATKLKPPEVEDKRDTCLLSHHDDGVVWGRMKPAADGYELVTSDSLKVSWLPEFRLITLQECRLFSARGELFLWWQDGKLKTRLVLDEDGADAEKCDYYDEKQVLWGVSRADKLSNDDFTIVFEGQGLRHAVPLKTTKANFSKDGDEENKRLRPLRLTVRHYLDYDDDGCAYVALSRLLLVGLA
jgi:CRISPR-associated protein (TIGR03984 family)